MRPCCYRVRCRSWVSIRPSIADVDLAHSVRTHRWQEHYDVAQGVKKILQRYKDLQDIIAILVLTSCRKDKLTVSRAVKYSASCRSRSMLPKSLPAFLERM